MDNDNRNYLEAGIAKSQIEATRRRLSRGESLEDLQEESISYLNEKKTGITVVLFLVFLMAYLFLGADTFTVLGMLIFLTGIFIYQTAKSLRIKLRIRAARDKDLSNYDK